MTKERVLQRIGKTGVVPVIRAASAGEAEAVVEAVSAGGVDVFEVTLTVPDAVDLIARLSARFGDAAVIGAGTVLTPADAAECIAAGAKFIISPALNLETIAVCREKGIAVMPGALTPTEIVTAWSAGADFVKVFPAGALGGANYIKSLKAPLPHIEIIPTGGVSLKTAADFIRAGAAALGVGADLVDLEALREGNSNLIKERAQQYLKIVREARQNPSVF